MSVVSRRFLQVFLWVSLAACGSSSDEPAGPTASERGDVDAILELLIQDEAILILEEADGFVAEDLPARAGEMLESGALPSMRRHIERMASLQVGTDLGRRLKESALEKLRARASSTAAYARVLSRGLVEDLAFVEASAAQRHAEAGLRELGEEIQAIRHPEASDEEDDEEETEEPSAPAQFDDFEEPAGRPRGTR